MKAYSPKEYWTGVAEDFCSADAAGFAPVLHPGAPAWFNQAIDALQFKALRRGLSVAQLAPGMHILDVGCGTGRWLRRYEELGFHTTGVDATRGMLAICRQQGTSTSLVSGEAQRLPFADASFDCVSDVTVVQHLPPPLQPLAIGEMLRVLKPEGKLILVELIRGQGSHIFPRAPQDWIQQAAGHGAKVLDWFGQEFLFPDRFFTRATGLVTGRNGSRQPDQAPETKSSSGRDTAGRRLYWTMRHVTVPLSVWTDPMAEKIFPARFATHGVFIFQK